MIRVCYALPLGSAWRIWRADEPSLVAWLVVVAEATALVAGVSLLGRWDIAGYYSRHLLLAALGYVADGLLPPSGVRDLALPLEDGPARSGIFTCMRSIPALAPGCRSASTDACGCALASFAHEAQPWSAEPRT